MKTTKNKIKEINNSMKTFRQYLAEAVKEIPMRIKIAGAANSLFTISG